MQLPPSPPARSRSLWRAAFHPYAQVHTEVERIGIEARIKGAQILGGGAASSLVSTWTKMRWRTMSGSREREEEAGDNLVPSACVLLHP